MTGLPKIRFSRERTHSIIVAFFESILGIMTFVLAWDFIDAGNLMNVWIAQMMRSPYTPQEAIDFFKSVQSGLYFVGAFIFLHGLKRIVDNVLDAWVKSSKSEAEEVKPSPIISPTAQKLSTVSLKAEVKPDIVSEHQRALRNISMLGERFTEGRVSEETYKILKGEFQSKLKQLEGKIKERIAELREEIKSLQSKKKSIEKSLEEIEARYLIEQITESEYRQKSVELKSQLNEIGKEISEKEMEIKPLKKCIE